MRAVVQKVSEAEVIIEGLSQGKISRGVCVFVAMKETDNERVIDWMVQKILNLRIFPDKDEKMNLSVTDIGGEILIISNFTLYGDCRKGTRPSYTDSAPPAIAEPIYNKFVEHFRNSTNLKVETGIFGAMMDVRLVNDGPVTLIIER